MYIFSTVQLPATTTAKSTTSNGTNSTNGWKNSNNGWRNNKRMSPRYSNSLAKCKALPTITAETRHQDAKFLQQLHLKLVLKLINNIQNCSKNYI